MIPILDSFIELLKNGTFMAVCCIAGAAFVLWSTRDCKTRKAKYVEYGCVLVMIILALRYAGLEFVSFVSPSSLLSLLMGLTVLRLSIEPANQP